MSDVIQTAAGALPQIVLQVARGVADAGHFPGQTYVVDSALQVCAGDTWDGAANTPPEQPEPDPVPRLIEMRKAILEMDATEFGEGTLLEAVEALIAASSRPTQLEWQRATTLSRSRDIVLGMQLALGLSNETMDALFIAADARP